MRVINPVDSTAGKPPWTYLHRKQEFINYEKQLSKGIPVAHMCQLGYNLKDMVSEILQINNYHD